MNALVIALPLVWVGTQAISAGLRLIRAGGVA